MSYENSPERFPDPRPELCSSCNREGELDEEGICLECRLDKKE